MTRGTGRGATTGAIRSTGRYAVPPATRRPVRGRTEDWRDRCSGNVVTIPLAPRTARVIDLAIGEWCEGPILVLVLG